MGEAQRRKERKKGRRKAEKGGEERSRTWREGEVEVRWERGREKIIKYWDESA